MQTERCFKSGLLVAVASLVLTQAAIAQNLNSRKSDPNPAATKQATKKQTQAKSGEQISDQPSISAKPSIQRRAPRPGVRSKAGSNFEPDPNAKWVCENDSVKLEPAWRGAQTLTFEFDIRNGGTADLKIRAKGG